MLSLRRDDGSWLLFTLPQILPPSRGGKRSPLSAARAILDRISGIRRGRLLSSFERGGPVFINFGKRMTDGKEGSKPFSRGAENKPRRKFFRFAGKRPARPTKINL